MLANKACTMFWTPKWGLKNGPKMVPEFDPQNGGPKMAPKSPKMAPKKIVKMKIKLWFLLDQDIGPPFGCHFWTPILVVKFWHHFWVHFSTPILGSKTWCKIWKNLLPKLICIAILFQQTCITKCMCSHGLASCSSEHNLILHLAKTRKITKSFDCHKCCT